MGDHLQAAAQHMARGMALFNRKQSAAALPHFNAAAVSYERVGLDAGPPQVALPYSHCMQLIGACSYWCENYRDALRYTQRALDLLETNRAAPVSC